MRLASVDTYYCAKKKREREREEMKGKMCE
jgi:hypothetical protein